VGVEGALVLAAGLSLLLVVLTVVLASVSAAAARNRLLGVLRILGMSTRQLRGILAWELGPLAFTAAVVGAGLGVGLAYLVTAVLDLQPFVGGVAQPEPRVEPLAVLAALAVFLVTVIAAGAIAVALGRRLAPSGAIKMGDA
jgi:Predicted ABC-type transport system involved in lysophospholipase L1 biosynthesis, permease component